MWPVSFLATVKQNQKQNNKLFINALFFFFCRGAHLLCVLASTCAINICTQASHLCCLGHLQKKKKKCAAACSMALQRLESGSIQGESVSVISVVTAVLVRGGADASLGFGAEPGGLRLGEETGGGRTGEGRTVE